MIPSLVVAGGADGRSRPTVALNLAVALSSLGHPVELIDRDRTAPLASALLGDIGRAARQSVVLDAGAGLGLQIRSVTESTPSARLVDAGPALDAASLAVVRLAEVVIVPLDATEESRSALDVIAGALDGESHRLRIVLSRVLPRDADRWRLVDDLEERFPGALSSVTVPMGRSTGPRNAARDTTAATLYAPTGRAARAYRSIARELAPRLGLAPVEKRV